MRGTTSADVVDDEGNVGEDEVRPASLRRRDSACAGVNNGDLVIVEEDMADS